MILVDLNQVMISNLMGQLYSSKTNEVDEDLLRHMVLNGIRSYRNKFSKEYGELVICCDDTNNWRKDSFPYYKAHRKTNRDESDLDWPNIFDCLNVIRDELKEFFPYRYIQVERAEADDAIGTLCYEFGAQLLAEDTEKILILSGDKDFIQLQKFANVSQWDPVRKRKVSDNDPENYLIEHILKGDRGDGVPNALSQDDVFVSGGRQKPMRQTIMQKIKQVVNEVPLEKINGEFEWAKGFHRNRKLVDLQYTPDYLREEILEQYNVDPGGREKLFNYFVKRKLNNLVENISEF
mgnify:CR=1 FL=1